MKISLVIFWSLMVTWWIATLYKGYNIQLGLDCWRGKRKFYYLKAKCHLWEDDGRFEFWKPEAFKHPHQDYLIKHPYEFEQLVEVLKSNTGKLYFAAVQRNGEWDWSFRDKSRLSFATFHIHSSLVIEMKEVKFSWKKFCLTY